jgi:phage terminase large subunit GpA-like protein
VRPRRSRPELAQTFTNLVLGEPWAPPATTIEAGDLLALREDFGALVPAGVRFLTMGCDVQDDELVGLLVGWGEGEEAWSSASCRSPAIRASMRRGMSSARSSA